MHTVSIPNRGLRLRGPVAATAMLLALSACTGSGDGFDWDLRAPTAGNTAEAARNPSASRPRADDRGVISYPGYQVVIARRNDTVASVASRLGIDAAALGRTNAIQPDLPLRGGEVLVLPGRVAEPMTGTAAPGPVDVGTIATTALDRVSPTTSAAPAATAAKPAPARPAAPQTGAEPIRHKVKRGETAYTVARLYNVTPRALAEWNGLGADLALREGQTLLIPPSSGSVPFAVETTSAPAPGQGSTTPQPPSAAKPLPNESPARAGAGTVENAPPSPKLPTTASSKMAMPADGKIIRAYQKGKYDGVGIGASAGSPVRAAADGTIAAITRDTEQVPIVVIRHEGNLLTVYANVDGISANKNDKVQRGQQIGTVRAGNPPFLHFEVRRGSESVDPMSMLQ